MTASEQTTTPGRRRLPRPERRAQVIRAAATAFLRGGYDGTSMDDVAEACGVTRLIVYRIFGTKEELYRAVLRSVVDRLEDEFADLGDGAEHVPDGRFRISARMLRVGRAEPDGFRLLWRHAEHEVLFSHEAHQFRAVATGFADALLYAYVDDPVFRRWAATTLVAHVHETVCVWLDIGDPARDEEFAGRMAAGLRALVAAWS